MQEIMPPTTIAASDRSANKATLTIEPCYPGYGTTLGNALRRVLLSSLPGAAVTAMKIKGVDHEFSGIQNIQQDVVDIISHLKQVRFAYEGEEPVRVSLSSKGKRAITAADFKLPAGVKISNPEMVIAVATSKDASFEMEAIVEQGRGYFAVEQREGVELEIGMIAIDAIFSPVRRVGYSVEDMRVGKMTNYDRLRMTLETDGTISPEAALAQASKMLIGQLGVIAQAETGNAPKATEEKAAEGAVTVPAGAEGEVLVKDIKLSTRTQNALAKANIVTAEELTKKTDEELLALSGFGKTALTEVKKELKKHGLIS